jgi:D-alanyl-D-alanine carboxypeptidase (penicillin-binding protein 5/6)
MAEHLAGSESGFAQRMNERAAQLGMEDTHFVNCTGLPADGHYTSARDIALMSRELMLAHPDIRNYTTLWMDTIRDGAFGLSNTNRLIRFYNGATGLKTGFTDTALYCLSATAQRDGMELIAVVLGAPSSDARFNAAKTMLDYGFATHTLTTVHPDRALPPVEVLLGRTDQVQPRLARDCRLLLARDSAGQVTTRITLSQDVQAPVEQGQRLGEMLVLVDGQERERVPIVADTAVPRLTYPGVLARLMRHLFGAP